MEDGRAAKAARAKALASHTLTALFIETSRSWYFQIIANTFTSMQRNYNTQ
jgi:hypothetical protein